MEPEITEPKLETVTEHPRPRSASRIGRTVSDWKPLAAKIGGGLAAVAAVGAVLSGLSGYWSAYKTVGEWFGPNRAANVSSARSPNTVQAPQLSIVVLPFANLSGDAGKDYFVDAVTEGLTSDLSRIPESFVIARNTAFTYKGKPIDVRSIGQELGVRYVLEGSVQLNGDQVRVLAQLIDSATGAQVWSDRFDRPRKDYLELQDDIATRIGQALRVQLVTLEGRRIELQRLTNPTALDLALQGWATVYKPTTAQTREEARRLFEQALAIDGKTLRALTGLSLILTGMVINGQSSNPVEDLRRAEELSLRAASLDPNGSLAHFTRARVLQAQKRQRKAVDEYRIAIDLDRSGSAPALIFLGEALVFTGRSSEAIPLFDRALLLSPRDSALGIWQFEMGRALLLLQRDDEALSWMRRAISTNPKLPYSQLYLAAAAGLAGDLADAREALTIAGKINPNYTTIARFKATDLSDDPAYVEQRRHVEDGLRKAGIAED